MIAQADGLGNPGLTGVFTETAAEVIDLFLRLDVV